MALLEMSPVKTGLHNTLFTQDFFSFNKALFFLDKNPIQIGPFLERALSVHCALYAVQFFCYGVATISRPLKIVGLFCRISSLFSGLFCNRDP